VTFDQRFVIDTNVIVSALLSPRSTPRQAFDLAFEHGIVLASESTLSELDRVLCRPKFERYLSEGDRLQFVAQFIRDTTVIEIVEEIDECRDPKDNKFLELAVSGGATSIVSGDADLLVLHPFRDIPIITPKSFISRI